MHAHITYYLNMIWVLVSWLIYFIYLLTYYIFSIVSIRHNRCTKIRVVFTTCCNMGFANWLVYKEDHCPIKWEQNNPLISHLCNIIHCFIDILAKAIKQGYCKCSCVSVYWEAISPKKVVPSLPEQHDYQWYIHLCRGIHLEVWIC